MHLPEFSFHFQPLPTWDLDDGPFRAWWFDPLVASLSFAVFINWYWWHERRLGLSNVPVLKASVFNALSQPAQAAVGYWLGIYLWRIVIPPAEGTQQKTLQPDGIPTNLSEAVYLLWEVASGLILYDAIFFVLRWAMHEIPCLRQFHHSHHGIGGAPLESRHVLRHGLVDAVLQVLVNILVQRSTVTGHVKSRLARALHNVLVIWWLTESHTAAPQPYIWRRWLVGVREHRRHHLANHNHAKSKEEDSLSFVSDSYYGRNHRYQQFFGYLDDARALLAQYQYQWYDNNLQDQQQKLQ